MGFTDTIGEFRQAIVRCKAELFPSLSSDAMIYTRHEMSDVYATIRGEFETPRSTRVAIVRMLVYLREAGRTQTV